MKAKANGGGRIGSLAASGVIVAIGAFSPAPSIAASCGAVAVLKIDNTTIASAESDPAGGYRPGGGA